MTVRDAAEELTPAWSLMSPSPGRSMPSISPSDQMSLAEAEAAIPLLKSIGAAALNRLVAASPPVPTTLGRAEDD